MHLADRALCCIRAEDDNASAASYRVADVVAPVGRRMDAEACRSEATALKNKVQHHDHHHHHHHHHHPAHSSPQHHPAPRTAPCALALHAWN
eukprot:1900297-Rhodomonas_salina.1